MSDGHVPGSNVDQTGHRHTLVNRSHVVTSHMLEFQGGATRVRHGGRPAGDVAGLSAAQHLTPFRVLNFICCIHSALKNLISQHRRVEERSAISRSWSSLVPSQIAPHTDRSTNHNAIAS